MLKGRKGVIENYHHKERNLLEIVSNIRYGKILRSIFVDAQTVMYSVKVILQTSLSFLLLFFRRIAIFSLSILKDDRIVVVAEQRPQCTEEEVSSNC